MIEWQGNTRHTAGATHVSGTRPWDKFSWNPWPTRFHPDPDTGQGPTHQQEAGLKEPSQSNLWESSRTQITLVAVKILSDTGIGPTNTVSTSQQWIFITARGKPWTSRPRQRRAIKPWDKPWLWNRKNRHIIYRRNRLMEHDIWYYLNIYFQTFNIFDIRNSCYLD